MMVLQKVQKQSQNRNLTRFKRKILNIQIRMSRIRSGGFRKAE